jgi:hypothetical protein
MLLLKLFSIFGALLVLGSGCNELREGNTTSVVNSNSLLTEGLVLWLDASDSSYMTVDSSNKVTQWRDKSGNSNHANQTNSSNQPTLTLNRLNPQPSIVFDGVDDFFRVEDHTSLKPSEITLFFVGKATAYTSYAATFINKSSNYFFWNDGYGLNVMEDSSQDQFQFWVNNYKPTSTYQNLVQIPYGAFHLWNGSYGNNISSFWVDGTLLSTELKLTGNIQNSSRAMTIGISYESTAETTVSDPINGEIAEIIIYNRSLSDTERKQVEKYIHDQWGI